MRLVKGTRSRLVAGDIDLGIGAGWEESTDGPPILGDEFMISNLADRTGVADATTAVQDKIDEIASTYGAGIVRLPPGTLLVTALELKSGILLRGHGIKATILKQAASQHTVVDTGTSSGGNTPTTFNDTSKSWTANAYRKYTVEILTGTGAGQKRRFDTNTTTQLTGIEIPWTTTPDGTSTYRILQPKHLITLDATSDEFCGISHLQLDGNKANQSAANDGIHPINTSGGATLGDTHHVIEHVLVKNPSGNGITIGKDVREARIYHLITSGAAYYGKETYFQGGTDNWFFFCTWQASGLSGFYGNGANDHVITNKAFGSGAAGVSGNGAGFIISQPQIMSACVAQENLLRGFHFMNVHSVVAKGLWSDANGGDAYLVDNSFDCQISGVAKSGAGLAYTTAYALHLINSPDRNDIHLNVRSSELSGGLIDTTGSAYAENQIVVNQRRYIRDFNLGGAVGVANEHFTFGKLSAPASGNPYYTIKTGSESPPKASVEGWDGTTSKKFVTFDYGNSKIVLGDTGVAVEIAGTLTFASVVASVYGTDGSTTDDHFKFGKTGAPAAGNPIHRWKTDGSAESHAIFESSNGTTTYKWFECDYTNDTVTIGNATGGSPAGSVVIAAAAFYPSGTTELGTSTNRWSIGRFGARVESIYGTDGGSTDEHFRFGKTSAPASGNPYYVLKTDASAQAVGSWQGWDGTSALTFFQTDFANGLITIGDGANVRPRFSLANSNPDSALLSNGSLIIWIDDVNHLLIFKVKYASGTQKTGSVALT